MPSTTASALQYLDQISVKLYYEHLLTLLVLPSAELVLLCKYLNMCPRLLNPSKNHNTVWKDICLSLVSIARR